MLYRYTSQVKLSLLEIYNNPSDVFGTDTTTGSSTASRSTYTIAVHSRHIQTTEDGCNVSHEKRCL